MIYPVALVLTAVAGILAFVLLGGLQGGQNPFQILVIILPIIGLGIAAAVITLVVLIFYLIGFGYMYKGRNELGPAHARNVRIALYLLILAIVLQASSIATTAILFSLAFRVEFPFGTTTFDAGMLAAAHVASIAFGIAVAACVAAHLVLTIRALAKPEHERFLYAAAAIGTATPGVVGAVLLVFLPRYIDLVTDIGSAPPLGAEAGLPGVVSAVMSVITVLLFFFAFRGAEGRLRSGELKPIVPPPATAAWMPAPASYNPYWQYAPQAPAPQAPPPAPPPTPPPP